MISKLRRFLACVLLVLLPLQATAVVAMCPHSKSAESAVVTASPAMNHCLHGEAGTAVDQHSGKGSEPQQGDQNQQSCCAALSACAMCAVVVSLPQAHKIESASQKSDFLLSSQFTSFIPEGLQRPPSIRL